MDGLRPRCSMPVHRHAGDALWPAGSEDGPAGNVASLRPDLRGTAEDDVVYERAIQLVAGYELSEQLSRKIDGVPSRKSSTSPPIGGPHYIDHHCLAGRVGSSAARSTDFRYERAIHRTH